ncbi:MAG TPA: flavodoxin family protein [Synergistaceae bacterium]|nr:flavodoxin family protein [Synergistaceae bacterium]
MRILAINGSPRGAQGNTEAMLQPFLEGARAFGAETEVVYARDLSVGFCQGCFGCWFKTPGRCILKDDMEALLERLRRADAVIWATPLYHFGMTAQLKAIMERTLPLADPHIVRQGSTYTHDLREGLSPSKAVLLSNCGFPEIHHFDGLLEQFRCLARAEGREDGAPADAVILRPGGEILREEALRPMITWYFDALRQAGGEFVAQGKISPQTQEILSRDLLPPEDFVREANRHFDEILASVSGAPEGKERAPERGETSVVRRTPRPASKAPEAGTLRIPRGPVALTGYQWLGVSFVPWALFWLLAGLGEGEMVFLRALIPLLLSGALLFYRRRFIDVTLFDLGSVAFFAGELLLSQVHPAFFSAFGDTWSYLALGALWMGSLITGTPLSAPYSRWHVAPEVSRHPLFLRTNAWISLFWGGVFLLGAALDTAFAHFDVRGLWSTVWTLVLLVPATWFTQWFIEWYPGRARKKAMLGPQAGGRGGSEARR